MRWALTLDPTGDTMTGDLTLAGEPPVQEVVEPGTPGEFHALLIVENTMSGDKRFVNEGVLTWRDLPLPLMGLDTTTEQHQEAVAIGAITRIERKGNELHGYGPWATTPEANAIRQHVRDGNVRGVSADLDDVEFELVFPPTDDEDGMVPILLAAAGDHEVPEGEVVPFTEMDPTMVVTSARIMGATVVPFPAFSECFVEDMAPDEPLALLAAAVGPHDTGIDEDGDWDGAAEEAKLPSPLSIATARAMYAWIEDGVDEADVPKSSCKFPHHEVGDNGAPGVANLKGCAAVIAALNGGRGGTSIPADDVQGVYDHVAKHYRDNDLEPPELAGSLAAAAAPVAPPPEWLVDLTGEYALTRYTPLTITDEGEVFGHCADWESCHLSFPDRCVTAPHSSTDYAFFHTGELRCADGSRVPVGHIAVQGGHADLAWSPAKAQAHYDDTTTCIADVRVGEDRFGIWVHGALRPDAHPNDVRTAMASGVSGDWRRIGGGLELIHLSNVNVPGFNNGARVRVRESLGMVAAVQAVLPRVEVVDLELDDAVVASLVERVAVSIGRDTASRRAALWNRVHPVSVAV